MGLIYKITNPNNRLYVGQTAQTAEERIIQHRSVRKDIKFSAIQRSVRKYGWDAHIFEIIEDNLLDEMLDDREIFWIKELNTFVLDNPKGGLNLTRGGKHRMPWKMNKKKVKKARLRCGENAPGWGKKLSEETKRKIAEGVSKYNIANGKRPSEECIKKGREKHLVKVVAYDRGGDFVGEYESIKACAKELGLDRKSVNDALNGKVQKHSKGYFFRKKEEGYPKKIDVSGVNIQLKKRPLFCLFGEDMVEFANPQEAAEVLGLLPQTIKDSARLNKPLRSKIRFIYKDDFLNQNRPCITGPYGLNGNN